MATKARRPDSGDVDTLSRARHGYDRAAWSEAFEQFTRADARSPLDPADLERFATAAHQIGRSEERDALSLRAQRDYLARGDAESAARCAFWLGFHLVFSGETARGAGWLARAQRFLDEAGKPSVIYGYLLLPQAVRALMGGDATTAHGLFERAIEIGRPFGETDLITFARLGMGRALIRRGHAAEGIGLIDEVMVAVTAGDVSPMLVGGMYCTVIEACHEVFDLRRAHEWTDALTHWCNAHPDTVPFHGQCLIRRAEVKQLHGEWPAAMDEVARACEALSTPPGNPAAGGAFYRQAELHRLRGSLVEAEAAYRVASERGRQPHPGLALLRLAQGRTDEAAAAIRRQLHERQDGLTRAQVLRAGVEVLIAANDLPSARVAANELSELARTIGAPYLAAAAAHGQGSVLLAEGAAEDALLSLRDAWATWRSLGAPFEAARTRVLIALAHRALGDEDTSAIELDAARRVFDELGAATESHSSRALATPVHGSATVGAAGDLTVREHEMLTLIATGQTNRAIATQLGISEKTVARHVSNIFMKLGLSSRAAATAYAYRHKLL